MTWGGTPILWSDGFSVAGVRKPTAGRGSERGEGLSRSEIGSLDLSPLSLSLPPSACWSICPWDNFIRGVLTMKIVDLPSRPSLRPSSLFGCPNLSPLFPSLPFPLASLYLVQLGLSTAAAAAAMPPPATAAAPAAAADQTRSSELPARLPGCLSSAWLPGCLAVGSEKAGQPTDRGARSD